MTKLNRLAIAAGAASALGALAAAGKGVNDAMGARPAGARLERVQRSPAYRAGAFHNTSRGTSSMPSGQRDVLRRFRENTETRRPAPPIPVVSTPHGRDRGGARHLVRARVVPRRARRRAPAHGPGVERALLAEPARRPATAARRAGAARPRWAGSTPSSSPTTTTTTSTWTPSAGSSTSPMPCSSCRSASGRTSTRGVCRPTGSSSATGRRATTSRGVRVTAVEAQHFSGRGLRRDGTLWASWVLPGRAGRVFFSGDTGFFDGYARLGAEHGPFDVSLMAVGAYDPAWHDIHLDPEEAVEATLLLRGGLLVPIHWCTFVLAPHPGPSRSSGCWSRQRAGACRWPCRASVTGSTRPSRPGSTRGGSSSAPTTPRPTADGGGPR